ncbi:MAG: regulatory protein RecX [Anaerolineales bacterium]|nr:regulatory protein RecX [Anaerolineales bacterium]
MAGEITALKLQSRNRKRVNVHIDGQYRFALSRVLTVRLRVGQEITENEIEDLKREDEEERAFQRALRLIARRPRAERELRDYFKRRRVPPRVQDTVIDRLREKELVDDQAFAEAWVENRRSFRPRSARALGLELRQKGVDSEIIKHVLEDHDDDVAAYAAALIGARRWKDADWKTFQQRLRAYLARRGFDYSTASSVVARVWYETIGREDESEV